MLGAPCHYDIYVTENYFLRIKWRAFIFATAKDEATSSILLIISLANRQSFYTLNIKKEKLVGTFSFTEFLFH